MDRVSEIRARCEAATPGPWQSSKSNYGVIMLFNGAGRALLGPPEGAGNAAFIAHARDDIPYLLARLDKKEAENRWIPVSERLPENGIDVLLYWSNDAQNEKYVDIERYHIDHLETLDRPWIRAIAWMPLPKPPEENN